jgi:hypothetical protein
LCLFACWTKGPIAAQRSSVSMYRMKDSTPRRPEIASSCCAEWGINVNRA